MNHPVPSPHLLPQGTLPPTYKVFVGRQPIYTQQLDVFAYELLFRSGEIPHARVTDGTKRPPAESWWVQKLSADLTAD